MRYGILGPLEVVGDAGPVRVAGAKQRALLVLLLLDANRVISADRLIDQLWGGRPPQRASVTLRSYVSVLRRVLGFQRRYQQTAMPFDWRFTRADLDRLLRRLDEPAQPIKAA